MRQTAPQLTQHTDAAQPGIKDADRRNIFLHRTLAMAACFEHARPWPDRLVHAQLHRPIRAASDQDQESAGTKPGSGSASSDLLRSETDLLRHSRPHLPDVYKERSVPAACEHYAALTLPLRSDPATMVPKLLAIHIRCACGSCVSSAAARLQAKRQTIRNALLHPLFIIWQFTER